MDVKGAVGVIGSHGAASSPSSARNGVVGVAKRKRSGAGFESSPGSVDVVENEEDEAERRRQPGVKRACNECRQQKVSQLIHLRRGRWSLWQFSPNAARKWTRVANVNILATMRCRARSFYYLLEMYAIEAGMQNRIELQAGGEAQQACGNGEAD